MVWWYAFIKIFSACTCMYGDTYCTIPPNLSPSMLLNTSFGAKPPNLMTSNTSGYTIQLIVTCVGGSKAPHIHYIAYRLKERRKSRTTLHACIDYCTAGYFRVVLILKFSTHENVRKLSRSSGENCL